MDLGDIHRRQDRYYDSLIASFERQLGEVVRNAQARLAGFLGDKLSITAGKVDMTPANLRIVRSLDDRFIRIR